MARYILNVLNTFLIWLLTVIVVVWLSTRAKPQLVVLDDVKIFDSVFISSELTTLPDKLTFIWTSTRDTSMRKLNYPCKIRYGLEFIIKQKSLHLVLRILLAGDIATNPGPATKANAQFGNLSRSHTQAPAIEPSKNEFGPSIALANMMSLAPKIDELRCFVKDTKLDLISLTETWLNDSVSEHHINIPGFNLLLKNRSSGVHGGVGLYV